MTRQPRTLQQLDARTVALQQKHAHDKERAAIRQRAQEQALLTELEKEKHRYRQWRLDKKGEREEGMHEA